MPCLIRTSATMLVCALGFITACNSPTASPIVNPSLRPSVSPSASPESLSPSPKPSATATPVSPFNPDGPVGFAAVKGYGGQPGFIDSDAYTNYLKTSRNDTVDNTLVIRSQAEFEQYLKADETLTGNKTPDSIDFSKFFVIVTIKITGAYTYQGEITGLRMQDGNLVAEYSYSVANSADPMLNDYIRRIFTITRIDQTAFRELKLNIRAKAMPPAASGQLPIP